MMNQANVSEYNRDQWYTLTAIERICRALSASEIEELKRSTYAYLAFRQELEAFQHQYVEHFCEQYCFHSGLSLCCGFESIFVFFADQVISLLFSGPDEIVSILRKLQQPNHSSRCVYLDTTGCVWHIRPVSCSMFFCAQVKERILESEADLLNRWKELQNQEKKFTFPDRPVLFDDIEAYFLARGVDSPLMYFHKSPGLLRLKARSGLAGRKLPSPRIQP
jgi:hypothetical protein